MLCKKCKGKRYNRQTLQITYKGKNIEMYLHMTAYEAREFFDAHKNIQRRLIYCAVLGLIILSWSAIYNTFWW